MHPTISFTLISLLSLTACNRSSEVEIRDDFKAHYDAYGVSGSFALYDQHNDRYILYNEAQFKQPFTPASTYKICNSLIGLETGVIEDENHTIAWDSVKRNPVWDKDHDLKNAFRNSTVWYYQELARRVGPEKMQMWLDRANYGNRNTSGGADLFWLTGGLRITPEQQIDFLRRLHDNELPFSQRSIDIVKKIMIVRDTAGYVLRSKTGWGGQDGQDIGWYVGYVETADNVYYFANCVQTPGKNNEILEQSVRFDQSRRAIVNGILTKMKILPEG